MSAINVVAWSDMKRATSLLPFSPLLYLSASPSILGRFNTRAPQTRQRRGLERLPPSVPGDPKCPMLGMASATALDTGHSAKQKAK
mmetsp:Transcript_86379/g.268367  ORF Transcript_86379/g.268367 Transcript_86379/m.268367 type:complete len:86 (+) Transcript_86379:741-998(+)